MSITATEAETVIAEQHAVNRGWAVYRRAMESEWAPHGKAIGEAVADLYGALKTYNDINNGADEPEAAFQELADEPGAFAEALAKAAEDVTGWTGEVIRLLPAAEGEK
jgi:phage-related minor tail protein